MDDLNFTPGHKLAHVLNAYVDVLVAGDILDVFRLRYGAGLS